MKFLDNMADGFLANRCETDQTGQLLFYPWGKRRKGYVIPSSEKKQEIKTLLRKGIKYAFLNWLFWFVGALFVVFFLVRLFDRESLPFLFLGYAVLGTAAICFPIFRSWTRAAQSLQRAPEGVVLSSSAPISKKDVLLSLKSPFDWLYGAAFLLFIVGAADYMIFILHNPHSLGLGITRLLAWWTVALAGVVTATLKRRKLAQPKAGSRSAVSIWLLGGPLILIPISVVATLWGVTELAKKEMGYIDHTGKVFIPIRYVRAEPFSDGLARIRGFSDNRQLLKFAAWMSVGVLAKEKGPYHDLYTKYLQWGFIDKRGQVVIPPKFADAKDFHEGLAAVQDESNGGWGYIDKSGQAVIPPQFMDAGLFSEGLAAVRTATDGKWGYIDKSGQAIIPPQFMDAGLFSERLAAVQTSTGGKWGYIDKSGQAVIPPQFAEAWTFSDGLAAVQTGNGGKLGYIDKSGRVVIPPQFQFAHEFYDGMALVRMEKDGKFGYIDKNGKVVIPFQFSGAWNFAEGVAAVRREENGKWGYIDKNGQVVIQFQFGNADHHKFSEGLAAFREFVD